jgi:hypothetical protein
MNIIRTAPPDTHTDLLDHLTGYQAETDRKREAAAGELRDLLAFSIDPTGSYDVRQIQHQADLLARYTYRGAVVDTALSFVRADGGQAGLIAYLEAAFKVNGAGHAEVVKRLAYLNTISDIARLAAPELG